MMRYHTIHQPSALHSTDGVGYSHATRAGNTIYLAGQIALDADGHLIGKGDIEAQTRQVYMNMEKLLQSFGGGLENIVKKTTYLTDRRHLEGFRRVRNGFFESPFPPNTLLFIDGLAHPDYLVEIEAVAVVGPV